jgi:hypothetical protein
MKKKNCQKCNWEIFYSFSSLLTQEISIFFLDDKHANNICLSSSIVMPFENDREYKNLFILKCKDESEKRKKNIA